MPNRRPFDAIGGFNFRVEIEGVTQGPFLAVEFLDTHTTVIEHRSGNDLQMRKIPGRHHYSNIVMRRLWTNNSELWAWRKTVLDGQVERKAGSVIMLNALASDSPSAEISRYNFFEGWPCRWRLGTWDALADGSLVEEIEIVVEKIERG